MECAGVQLPRAWRGAGKLETLLLRSCKDSNIADFFCFFFFPSLFGSCVSMCALSGA